VCSLPQIDNPRSCIVAKRLGTTKVRDVTVAATVRRGPVVAADGTGSFETSGSPGLAANQRSREAPTEAPILVECQAGSKVTAYGSCRVRSKVSRERSTAPRTHMVKLSCSSRSSGASHPCGIEPANLDPTTADPTSADQRRRRSSRTPIVEPVHCSGDYSRRSRDPRRCDSRPRHLHHGLATESRPRLRARRVDHLRSVPTAGGRLHADRCCRWDPGPATADELDAC